MTHTIKDSDLSQLSPADRIMLAQELWDSVNERAKAVPMTKVQRQELDRRLAEIESGKCREFPGRPFATRCGRDDDVLWNAKYECRVDLKRFAE
jgi:putative addiction module component (TIGR02574 family)